MCSCRLSTSKSIEPRSRPAVTIEKRAKCGEYPGTSAGWSRSGRERE